MLDLSSFYIVGTFFSMLLVAFILFYVILHQKKVNQYNLQLKEQELQKQNALIIALTEGEEKERKRLAEELHDGIGAKLSGLKMSLEYLSELDHTDKELLNKVSIGVSESINELREISQNLKPSNLFSKGLNQTLTEFVEHLNNKSTCDYSLYIDNIDKVISQEMQFLMYRIISELLHNIQKHAAACKASIQVFLTEEGHIQLIAEDNGKGFKEAMKANGIGISNIKSRIEVYNGKINIDSSSAGTIIIVEIPIV